MNLSAVEVCAEGLNHARLLSALQKEDIKIFGFTRLSGRQFRFSVRKKDMRKTFAILDEMCYTYSASKMSEGQKRLKHILTRAGLIAGVLVFSVLVALSRMFVWRIKITGNETVPDKVIENVLAEQHIKVGKKLAFFDSDSVNSALRQIDGVKIASAYVKGTTVYVDVHESESTAPPMAYSDTDILSEYDATVTRVITRSGTALVEPGQNVFAGTPLIGAYRAPLEGEEPIADKASGIVYGKIAYTESVTLATEWYEYEPAKTYKRTRLGLFGLKIGKKPKANSDCTVEESVRKFNAFLPIKVITSRVTEMTKVKKSATAEELAAKAQDEIVLAFINSRVNNGFEVSRTVRDLGGGLIRVNVFIEAEVIIGGA